VSRLAWTDPAPLEVQRPRLPWWTMCPRKLLWAASPVILVVILVTALVFLGRRVWRYPLLVIGVTALAGLGIGYSWRAPIELLAAVAVGCGMWAWAHPGSFHQTVVRQVRSEWRRVWSTPGRGNGRCCSQT
jgi:S-DNA-T family DNA segregation ATPase FtsK/SpoIIIE